jgi:hypothetical protein
MLAKHKKKLDKIWSLKVKENADNKDELDGTKEYINAHHFIGRRNMATRWWLPNGVALSPKNHTFGIRSAHQDPEWFRAEMINIRGNLWLKELSERSNKIVKPIYEKVLSYLNGETNAY